MTYKGRRAQAPSNEHRRVSIKQFSSITHAPLGRGDPDPHVLSAAIRAVASKADKRRVPSMPVLDFKGADDDE